MPTSGPRFLSFRAVTLAAVGLVISVPAFAATGIPTSPAHERVAQTSVPFVENCGQWDERVAFAARVDFGTIFVTRTGQLVYSLGSRASDGWTLTETAISGTPAPQSGRASATRVSDFHGNDPGRWQSGLASYEEIGLGEVWRGISVSLRARGTSVEKIFALAPDAKAGMIRLRLDGARSLRIAPDGALVAATGNGEVRLTAPSAYQEQDGVRRPVAVAYVLHGTRYGFHLGVHDHSLPVIIDPLLQSTYLGGSLFDDATGIAIHPTSHEVFVTGVTNSIDFPGTAGGARSAYGGGTCAGFGGDVFVARLDPTLTSLLQATFLGGSDCDYNYPNGMAIQPTSGDVLVAGWTRSTDFPATAGGAQPAPGGDSDGFVVRLDPTLTSLLQSTYLGGSDSDLIASISIDPSTEEVFVAGSTDSADFPGTAGGAQSTNGGAGDIFVARLDSTLTTLQRATYLGGSGQEFFLGVVAFQPSSGEVLVAGATLSTDFPGTDGGAQSAYGGGDAFGGDAFVARLDPSLTSLLQATYLGGSRGDTAYGLAVDPSSGDVLVAGATSSTDLPGTAFGAQPTHGGQSDAFIARLNPTLTTLLAATYLGGSGDDSASGMAIHSTTGEVLVAGGATSTDFPSTAGGAQPAPHGADVFGGDAFVARLDPTLAALLQATYLGGSGGDSASGIAIEPATGEVFVAGFTTSPDFPETAGGAQPAPSSFYPEAFIARLTPDLTALLSPDRLFADQASGPGNGDFVFEPGETVAVNPYWLNLSNSSLTPSGGHAFEFSGPPGATYTIVNDTVSYNMIPPGALTGPVDPYLMSISVPAIRPATHWDAWFMETLGVPFVLPFRHTMHVGGSFTDVPQSNIFYRYIEAVLHHEITAGCGEGTYCPGSPVTRAQMAVFLLKSKHGSGYVPPACAGVFEDVACPGPFADWIEQLFREGITGGCGVGSYCPDTPLTRAQMSALLLKAKHGPSYLPPPDCRGIYFDVSCSDLFALWIEQLQVEEITAGCGAGFYCPNEPITRGQMAVFLLKTFDLSFDGP